MTRFASIAVAAATLLSAAAPAFAGEAPRTTRVVEAAPRIVVFQCERDPLTQASFRRDHGSRAVYVTADQVMSARASGERWSAPRCMTASEHRRLTEQLGVRSRL